ncbi:MAG TPA: DsbA family protein [Kofleriaceae bacterium]|nr:DsbA family protein [Kofleriaceae bacterium]
MKQKLRGLAIQAFLSDPVRRAREQLGEAGRKLRGQTPAVDFWFQVDDPHSYLLAQAVARIADAYPGISWRLHTVPPPAADVVGDATLAPRWALRDAAELALHWDVDFPAAAREPDPGAVQRANQVMVVDRPFAEQLEAALAVAGALWKRDRPALDAAMGRFHHEASGVVAPTTQRNYARLRDAGHYRPAVLSYGGEHFWGLDRLPFLEDRLRRDADRPDAPPALRARPEAERPPQSLGDGPLALELFFSFRSPYSYLAVDRTAALAEQYGLPLVLRPLLPMTMRGVEAPRAKTLYIVQDAKREADRLGIPFGRICDPLGPGIERCLATFQAADRAGAGLALTRSLMQGIWSEAADATSYVDMRRIVERAGLAWEQVAEPGDGWREMVRSNGEELGRAGLWGVPSFRVGSFSIWGQDRIPMLADRLRRHRAAAGAAA